MCYRSECPIQIGFILNSLDSVTTSFVVAASELRLLPGHTAETAGLDRIEDLRGHECLFSLTLQL